LTERIVRADLLSKSLILAVILCGMLVSAAQVASQAASTHSPASIVSDWTHHHLLFPDSANPSVMAQFRTDPRWIQNWYLRHRENWWPGLHSRRWRKKARRDWSVPLGIAYYEPLFDSTFTFSIGPQAGSGVLTSADLGSGQLFATAGVLNVSAGSDLGNYSLYPGGPVVTTSPNGAFIFDNLIFPLQDPVLDVDGLLFVGGGNEVNVWGNSPGNYSFYTWSGGSYITSVTSAGTVTPVVSPAPDPGGSTSFPAKFAFDVNAAPSCTNDFVVMGIPSSAVASQANIIGLNNLYSNTGGTGYCPTTGPTVLFAYTSGTGQVPASVVISQSGQQVAYVENLPGNSFFHVLTIGTTGTNGTGATSPVAPGAAGGNNAVDVSVRLSPDGGTTNQSSTNAPFVVFTSNDSNDVAYATTYDLAGAGSGYIYKLSNVFNGSATPTIVWSIPVTAIPSAPVYDNISNKVFFTDSAGRIDYVIDSGVSPSVFYGPTVASGSTSENAVIVDSTRQMIYASFNSNGTNAIVVQAPTSLASTVSVPAGAANTTYTGPYLPDFNRAWYTGSGTPMMFVAGTGAGTLPTLYGVGFTAGVMNSSATSSAALATGAADSSPISEFYNSSLQKDFLFVGVTNNCIATTQGGAAGCVMSLDITNGFPTVNASTTALAASGGTSGIIPDNVSNLPEASSIYYATKTGTTLVKATQAALQ